MAEPQGESDEGWSDTVRPGPQTEEERRVAEVLRPRGSRPARAQRRSRDGRPSPAVVIALGLAVVALLVIVGVTVVQWRAQVAAQEKLRSTQEAQRQAEIQAEQIQREALARQAELQAEQQRQEEARIKAYNDQQKAADDARRAEAEAADRKEKAWTKYYRAPAHCETSATMDCTNRYIRAKREFEEKFAKGLL